MNIEIKKSKKPVKYEEAIRFMENRLTEIDQKKSNELIWILEHEDLYTAGTNYKENEILDKSIKILKTNRGGKITFHGTGQLVFYFVIDLKNKKKDIRKFISLKELIINNASLLAILSVTTFIYSLLNSKLTFLSLIFLIKVINIPIIQSELLIHNIKNTIFLWI